MIIVICDPSPRCPDKVADPKAKESAKYCNWDIKYESKVR